MKSLASLLLLAAVTGGIGQSGVQPKREIRAQDGGGIVITGWDDWMIEMLPNKRIEIMVTGNPVATWPKQGIELKAATLVLTVTTDQKLISAQLKQGVTFTANKADSRQRIDVKAASAVYTEATQKLDIEGLFTLDTKASDTGEAFHVEGRGGTISLDRSGEGTDLVKSAQVGGRVKFKLSGARTEDDGKTKLPFYVNAGGDSLTYSRTSREVVLSGNVSLDGDDPSLFGDISGVNAVTITLSPTGSVRKIHMKGDPGKTRVEQKGKSGGGNR